MELLRRFPVIRIPPVNRRVALPVSLSTRAGEPTFPHRTALLSLAICPVFRFPTSPEIQCPLVFQRTEAAQNIASIPRA